VLQKKSARRLAKETSCGISAVPLARRLVIFRNRFALMGASHSVNVQWTHQFRTMADALQKLSARSLRLAKNLGTRIASGGVTSVLPKAGAQGDHSGENANRVAVKQVSCDRNLDPAFIQH